MIQKWSRLTHTFWDVKLISRLFFFLSVCVGWADYFWVKTISYTTNDDVRIILFSSMLEWKKTPWYSSEHVLSSECPSVCSHFYLSLISLSFFAFCINKVLKHPEREKYVLLCLFHSWWRTFLVRKSSLNVPPKKIPVWISQ